jgi:CheY-like chemotaxis protein
VVPAIAVGMLSAPGHSMEDSPSRRTILFIDDASDVRSVFATILAHEGFRVLEAGDAALGIALALASTPDVIVMDVSLGLLDGVLAARVMRVDPRTRAIPILAFTGRTLDARERATFDGVVTKPCGPEALLRNIRAALA